jgi:DSF synthase
MVKMNIFKELDGSVVHFETMNPSYKQLVTRYDKNNGVMWCFFDPMPRPCFTPTLLADLKKFQRIIEIANRNAYRYRNEFPVQYVVGCSINPNIYSFGGDLALFIELVKRGDEEGLRSYSKACIDVMYTSSVSYNFPITTISLVQGDALGGGFEAALSCKIIIAEEKAKFGFPEVLFNLFPGMGAYNLLARRIDMARAEKLIMSGRLYKASELYEMGVIDILVGSGQGEKAVCDFISQHAKKQNAYRSLYKVRQRLSPIKYEEFRDIADIWVEAALKLRPKDLQLMEKLIKAQDKMTDGSNAKDVPEEIRA